MAVQTWKKQIIPSFDFQKADKNQSKAPAVKASIDWVHGYRGFKTHNNVRCLKDNRIAYHSAGLGIIYDPETQT